MKLKIQGIATGEVERLRRGGLDSNGQAALRRVAEGPANPCRHCMQLIAEGDEKLVLAWRPFEHAQPYAETGPVFLHAASCPRYDSDRMPDWFVFLEPAVVRGYDCQDWIRYDTGQVIPGADLDQVCRSILEDEAIAYVHVRSRFGCFQCRVDRA